MASPPGAGGSRYVGRVVDPDVRDDGETEPEVELNPSPRLAPAVTADDDRPSQPLLAESVVTTEPDPAAAPELGSRPDAARGAEMRERLLAKARAAELARHAAPSGLDAELESIGQKPEARTEEAEDFVAFRDIAPQAPVHILIIPKRCIPRIADTTPDDADLLGRMLAAAPAIARSAGVAESGYRLVINNGRDAGESVPHLHIHLLGGRAMQWPPG